jgi:MazG family protein
MDAVDRLVDIMARLRGPEGCPWDRKQTAASLRTYLLEEAYEVAQAIDDGDWDELRGELGDLLLQVVFLSQIAQEAGHFGLAEVAEAISDKLVRRHPHVFAEAEASSVAEVWKSWEEIKRGEGGGRTSRIEGIPAALPALVRAHRLAEKAARVGFDWPSAEAVLGKVDEELGEIREALERGSREDVEEELGDLMFALASFARREGIDPEGALAKADAKFTGRFRAIEREADRLGVRLEDMGPEELDRLWRSTPDRSG